GQVDRGLGEEHHLWARVPPPLDHGAKKGLGARFVADEVVVDDEHRVLPAHAAKGLQFFHKLRGRLGPRHPAVHHDDVAELAIVGASPRILRGHRYVAAHADEVVARYRSVVQPGESGGAIDALQGARLEVRNQLGYDILGLAKHKV